MLKLIIKDKWWPVYSIEEPIAGFNESCKDIPEELIFKYERALTEFNEVQKELSKLYNE